MSGSPMIQSLGGESPMVRWFESPMVRKSGGPEVKGWRLQASGYRLQVTGDSRT